MSIRGIGSTLVLRPSPRASLFVIFFVGWLPIVFLIGVVQNLIVGRLDQIAWAAIGAIVFGGGLVAPYINTSILVDELYVVKTNAARIQRRCLRCDPHPEVDTCLSR